MSLNIYRNRNISRPHIQVYINKFPLYRHQKSSFPFINYNIYRLRCLYTGTDIYTHLCVGVYYHEFKNGHLPMEKDDELTLKYAITFLSLNSVYDNIWKWLSYIIQLFCCLWSNVFDSTGENSAPFWLLHNREMNIHYYYNELYTQPCCVFRWSIISNDNRVFGCAAAASRYNNRCDAVLRAI